jgi:hypothetical protein
VRKHLDQRVLELIGRGVDAAPDESGFDELARELFQHQYQHNAPYRRLCQALGCDPSRVESWREITPVPTGAFKRARLAAFPAQRDVKVFRTSGSTTAERGSLYLDTLELYEASLLASFAHFICAGERIRFAVLAPPAPELPDSSLSHMFSCVVERLGAPGSRFLAHAAGWRPEAAIDELASAEQPIAVLGTAFAFVHLLDALDARELRLSLPAGSRAMETGGFKGRSRELPREQLHAGIATALGIVPGRIVNQYGMCELGSQFYEDSLLTGSASCIKRVPPWVRTRVVDPGTLADVPAGETGVLVHYDLANTGSVVAVQTSDLGRAGDGGFEVLGRIEGAEARGCSLAADALLGAHA